MASLLHLAVMTLLVEQIFGNQTRCGVWIAGLRRPHRAFGL